MDIFLEVFKDINFPFLSADLGRFVENKHSIDPENVSSYMLLPIPKELSEDKQQAFISAFRGIIRKIDVPDNVINVLLKSEFIASLDESLKEEFEVIIRKAGEFLVVQKVDELIWEERTVWPAIYSSFIDNLLKLTSFHTLLISQRIEKLSKGMESKGFAPTNFDVLSEYPRTLPTGIQYAFASLGAWIGGASNFQYFGYYASIRQIHHSDLNTRYLDKIGYIEREINDLNNSGIIGLPLALVFPLLEAQQNNYIFGSIPIDEPNLANMPDNSFSEASQVESVYSLPGFILDKYYRTVFRARKPSHYAFYGQKTLLRDHYDDFYNQLNVDEFLRCKHYSVPLIDVTNMEQIESYVKKIPIHSENGLFFRGQRKLYMIERHEDVKQMLFGHSCSAEPSLITSAARDPNYHYDDLHFNLKFFIEQKVLSKSDPELTEKWRALVANPTCTLDMAIMALAQHYGLPSHGLDITNNLDIALWFATNIFQSDGEAASYKKMNSSDWPEDKSQWPVIIVCQTITHSINSSIHDCQKLEEFGFVAKRPNAQHASFFQGGHSDHQNRLAESVVCVFRLPPNEYITKCSFSSLFPTPEEDAAYQLMLDFASSDLFGKKWGHFVNRFHYK